MHHTGHRLSGGDVAVGQPLLPLNGGQHGRQAVQVIPTRPGKPHQGLVHLPVAEHPQVSGLCDVVQTSGQVVTMILGQSTEPLGPGKLCAPLGQGKHVPGGQEPRDLLAGSELRVPALLVVGGLHSSLLLQPGQHLSVSGVGLAPRPTRPGLVSFLLGCVGFLVSLIRLLICLT